MKKIMLLILFLLLPGSMVYADFEELEDKEDYEGVSVYLSDIKIKGYEIDFIGSTFEYQLDIANEESLEIEPILENDIASYKIIGNENLQDGGTIKIQVYTPLLIQDYIIKVNPGKVVYDKETIKKKNYTLWFILIIVILLIVNMIRLFLRKKKEK